MNLSFFLLLELVDIELLLLHCDVVGLLFALLILLLLLLLPLKVGRVSLSILLRGGCIRAVVQGLIKSRKLRCLIVLVLFSLLLLDSLALHLMRRRVCLEGEGLAVRGGLGSQGVLHEPLNEVGLLQIYTIG